MPLRIICEFISQQRASLSSLVIEKHISAISWRGAGRLNSHRAKRARGAVAGTGVRWVDVVTVGGMDNVAIGGIGNLTYWMAPSAGREENTK